MALLLSLLPGLPGSALADDQARADDIEPHPLELRALSAPEEVLSALPAALQSAETLHDQRELARLYLARANACRVISDWVCQRDAGMEARKAATLADHPGLIVRGLILESRALMAMQDYAAAEQLLTDAQTRLTRHPVPELAADVMLGLSSLAHQLGKLELSADYARRGLSELGADQALPMQVRLRRNLARALVDLGQLPKAREELEAAVTAATRIEDPKLRAELHMAASMLAARVGDSASQRGHIDAMMVLAAGLTNSQIYGQGREALAGLFMAQNDIGKAEQELRAAVDSFHGLGLPQDEQRALQSLIQLLLKRGADSADLAPAITRLLQLHRQISADSRAEAADDFETRIAYAEQQVELAQLESEARLAKQRAEALANETWLSRIALALGLLALILVGASYAVQRRSNQRLRLALKALRNSESRTQDLLQLSRGAVFMHDFDGHLQLLNPAAAEALGQHAPVNGEGKLQHSVAEADRDQLRGYLDELRARGEAEAVLRFPRDAAVERALRLSGRVSSAAQGEPYAVSLAIDVTDELNLTAHLREQAQRDPLTGCFNRRYLELFEQAMRSDSRWAVINIDLDHFKQVNDEHGHERGDQVLREVAEFFQARLRESDALVRSGGDEFLILLSQAGTTRLNGLLGRLNADRAKAPCGYSLGCAIRDAGESLQATLARADAIMYEQRRLRRGQ